MKFHRQELIARVEAAIAAQHKFVQDANAKAEVEYAEKLASYVQASAPAWRELADTIRRRLRADKPMLVDDIPRDLRGGWNNAVWTSKPQPPRVADTAALEQLRILLDAATDDEVSTSTLERMGFRTAALFTR